MCKQHIDNLSHAPSHPIPFTGELIIYFFCIFRPPVGASPAPCWLDQSCSEKDQLRDGDERRKGHAAPAVGDYDDRLVVLYDEVM